MQRDVREQAQQQIAPIARDARCFDRAGGSFSVSALAQRIAQCEPCATYADDLPAVGACAAVARAIVCTERLRAEYDEAAVDDVALTRARELLVEAGMLLECVAVNTTHAARLSEVRAHARDT